MREPVGVPTRLPGLIPNVAFAAALVASCAPPPPPTPAAPPTPPTAAPKPPALPTPACADAARATRFLDAVAAERAMPGNEDCAVRRGLAALPSCPELAARYAPALAALRARERADMVSAVATGRWAVQHPAHGPARVWELTDAEPILRYRLDISLAELRANQPEPRFLSADRMLVQADERLVLLDLPTGAVHEARGVRLLAEHPRYLFARRGSHALRLRRSDLSSEREIGLGEALSGEARALPSGDGLVLDDALISFDQGKVLARGMLFGSLRRDGERVTACDPKRRAVVELDTRTGAETGRFALRADGASTCESMARTIPAHAPYPRYVFWFELGAETPDRGRRISVASGDTVTGAVKRLMDPVATSSTGFNLEAALDPTGQRLCARVITFKSSWTMCDWTMDATGTLTRSPRPRRAVRPSLRELGLLGVEEAARARSPSGARTAIAVYREVGDASEDLTLIVLGAGAKVERRLVIKSGAFPLDRSGMVGEDVHLAPDTYVPPPRLVFLGEDVVAYEAMYFPCNRIDLATGKVTFDESTCAEGGHSVLDPVRKRRVRLDADEATWAAAPLLADKCR